MKSGIYKITNKENGKFYVGSAQNLRRRKNSHLNCLKRGVHDNEHLQRSYDKYGIDSFDFSIIELCEIDALLEREQYYLDQYFGLNECYNMSRYASHPMKGRKHTKETREKMSASAKGKPKTVSQIEKMKGDNNPSKRKEVRDKISKNHQSKKEGYISASKGKKHSSEAKQKISDKKSITVCQINKDTKEVISTYKSSVEAMKKTGIDQASIKRVCTNKQKTAGGYLWKRLSVDKDVMR